MEVISPTALKHIPDLHSAQVAPCLPLFCTHRASRGQPYSPLLTRTLVPYAWPTTLHHLHALAFTMRASFMQHVTPFTKLPGLVSRSRSLIFPVSVRICTVAHPCCLLPGASHKHLACKKSGCQHALGVRASGQAGSYRSSRSATGLAGAHAPGQGQPPPLRCHALHTCMHVPYAQSMPCLFTPCAFLHHPQC